LLRQAPRRAPGSPAAVSLGHCTAVLIEKDPSHPVPGWDARSSAVFSDVGPAPSPWCPCRWLRISSLNATARLSRPCPQLPLLRVHVRGSIAERMTSGLPSRVLWLTASGRLSIPSFQPGHGLAATGQLLSPIDRQPLAGDILVMSRIARAWRRSACLPPGSSGRQSHPMPRARSGSQLLNPLGHDASDPECRSPTWAP
jgi:hypothetical protein